MTTIPRADLAALDDPLPGGLAPAALTPPPGAVDDRHLKAALGYATNRGWPVFPLQERGKTPFPGSNGHLDATVDPAQIRTMWETNPTANIGIACEPAGLVVIDLDSYHNDIDIEGWQKGRPLPDTYATRTGRGGLQLAYLAPDGAPLKGSSSRLAPYIDVKARGGYVVAPPSVTVERYTVTDERDPVPLPTWIIEEIHGLDAQLTLTPTPAVLGVEAAPGYLSPYAQKVFEEEGDRLARAREGSRNEIMNKVAFRFGQLHARGHVDHALAERCLRQAAECASNRGDSPLTAKEIDDAVNRSMEAGRQKPGNTPYVEIRLASHEPVQSPPQRSFASTPTRLKVRAFEDITESSPALLWDQRLVRGGFTVLGGNGDTGKSSLALNVAMSMAIGTGLPGQGTDDRGSSLFVSYEDPPAVSRDRLLKLGYDAAGAPYGTIKFLNAVDAFTGEEGRHLTPGDMEMLADEARQIADLRLIVLDPLMQFIGATVNPLMDNQIRAVLANLQYVAAELDTAVLVIAHTHKGTVAFSQLADWIAGSAGIKNFSRSALVALKEPRTGRHFLVHAKHNWSPRRDDLEYRFHDGAFEWAPTPPMGLVENLMSSAPQTDMDQAAEFLQDLLTNAGGTLLKGEIVEAAKAQGLKMHTVERAKTALGLRVEKTATFPANTTWSLAD